MHIEFLWEKWPLGRPRRRWEDNIKMDLREVGGEDARWVDLAQDRVQWRALVLSVLNLRALATRVVNLFLQTCYI